jgi:type I restriction enzyme, S subunit
MPCPPKDEQRSIVVFLNEECAKLNRLVVEANDAISLLLERRAAIISAAVTGQIDVRNFA